MIDGTFVLSLVLVRDAGGSSPRVLILIVLALYVLAGYPAFSRWFRSAPVRRELGFD